MTIYTIYKLTNTTNGKSYIGFTSKTPERRWQTHLENAQKKRNCYVYDAINKYGWDGFTKEVLYQSKDGDHTLNEMEPFFIRQYNTYYMDECGYNMTHGGGGALGMKHSKEFKQTRATVYLGKGNPFFGKHHSEAHKLKVGVGVKRTRHLQTGDRAPFAGHKHSAESRKQIGDTQAGTWTITFPDKHVETVVNLRAFCREHTLTAPLMLSVAKGVQHHHKGFHCAKVVVE